MNNDMQKQIKSAVDEAVKEYFTTAKISAIKVKVKKVLDREINYITGEGLKEHMNDEGYEDIFEDLRKDMKTALKGAIKGMLK